MTFISHAQNYEDVILWRALRHVERGFYVHVGAADPDFESVTRAFYERGWSGINIAPLDEHFTKLVRARPRDTNLKVLVGREAGLRTFQAFPGTGLPTPDTTTARPHEPNGLSSSEIIVPTLTLTKIIEDCGTSVIHFLKIDVEGAEAEVLEGLNLEKIRPWVIAVEASEPLSMAITRSKWERLITDRGYEFAYFDGLNCFYVADEVAALKERLAVPPNFSDDYMRFGEWNIRQRAANLEQEVASLRERSRGLEAALQAEHAETSKLRSTLQVEKEKRRALQSEQTNEASLRLRLAELSRRLQNLSIQLGMPSVDRAIGRALKCARESGDRLTGGGLRSFARRVLITSIRRAAANRRVTTLARVALERFPGARTALNQFATKAGAVANSSVSSPESRHSNDANVEALPASARSTYARLKAALSDGEGWNSAQ